MIFNVSVIYTHKRKLLYFWNIRERCFRVHISGERLIAFHVLILLPIKWKEESTQPAIVCLKSTMETMDYVECLQSQQGIRNDVSHSINPSCPVHFRKLYSNKLKLT